MRILITGATGFIGQKLLKLLTDHNHTVAIHSRNQPEGIDSNVLVFSGELNQFQDEIIAFSPQYVFHLVGSSIYPKNKEDEEVLWSSNVQYGNTLLAIVKEIPELIFVNFTTSLAYEGSIISPSSFYALTKANFIQSLEYFARFYTLRVFNLILYTVYGKGDKTKRAINYILDSLDAIEPISMSPGEQIMDFIHVDDVIRLCMHLLENKPNEKMEEIHVGTGSGSTLKQAAVLIESLSDQKANIQFGSIPYRREEKMVNIAPVSQNRFWKSSVEIETGFLSLI
jgi:nucleoside-diphosphate-sugar epimerase